MKTISALAQHPTVRDLGLILVVAAILVAVATGSTTAFLADPYTGLILLFVLSGISIVGSLQKKLSVRIYSNIIGILAAFLYFGRYGEIIGHLTKGQEQWLIVIGISVLLVSVRVLRKATRWPSDILERVTIGLVVLIFLVFATAVAYTAYSWAISLNQYEWGNVCVVGAFAFAAAGLIIFFGRIVMRLWREIDTPTPSSSREWFRQMEYHEWIAAIGCFAIAVALYEIGHRLGAIIL